MVQMVFVREGEEEEEEHSKIHTLPPVLHQSDVEEDGEEEDKEMAPKTAVVVVVVGQDKKFEAEDNTEYQVCAAEEAAEEGHKHEERRSIGKKWEEVVVVRQERIDIEHKHFRDQWVGLGCQRSLTRHMGRGLVCLVRWLAETESGGVHRWLAMDPNFVLVHEEQDRLSESDQYVEQSAILMLVLEEEEEEAGPDVRRSEPADVEMTCAFPRDAVPRLVDQGPYSTELDPAVVPFQLQPWPPTELVQPSDSL